MIALSSIEVTNQSIAPPWEIGGAKGKEGALDTPYCISSTQRLQAKDTVFFEGDPATHLYEVIEGVLKLYKLTPDGRRQITGFLYPGQLLGLNVGDSFAYSAEAITKTVLCRYPRKKLDQALDTHPALARRFLRATVHELAVAQDQMLLLGQKSAIEKTASFLLRLSDQNRERGEDPELLYLPMTRTDIGDYLGMTTETVSRTMTRLKTAGIIRLHQQGGVSIMDIDQLMELAEGDDCDLAV